jgi:hypothetical protein
VGTTSQALAPRSAWSQVSIGNTGTPQEREADRMAHGLERRAIGASLSAPLASLRPSPWRAALERELGAGAPLDAASRGQLERHLRVDLGAVRLHRGDAAQTSSAMLRARAWTLGTDVVLGAGAPQTQTPQGRVLLGHEISHVLQQSLPAGASQQAASLGMSPAPYQVQRQPSGPPAAATATFSVNQATYLGLINQALGQMSGRLVLNETLAATVVPILQAMLASVTWKDAQGVAHGGGAIQHALPGGVTLNLRLILDDAANSLRAGEFTHRGSTDGEMEIFIQRNTTADELAETLYHESMHLVSWLINRPTPALALTAAGRSGPAGAAATLTLARSSSQIATVRLWLDTLAQSVNQRRAAGAQIGAADLDRMASWLVEEVNVRSETEVFRLAASTQQALTARGPTVIIGTGANWQINATMVDRYVFDFSQVFLPADRAGLTPADRQALATLMQILEGIFQNRVRRRFSPSPYLVGRGIPRAPFTWTPPPLTPPSSFGPLPLP